MEIHEVKQKCPNCEETGNEKPSYFYRKVNLHPHRTTKATEGIAVYCGLCNRTVTVLPASLFPAVGDYPEL